MHIGAFRFVCTNLAVGGGGVFAGGFMSVHAGEIPLEGVTQQLSGYLAEFDRIVALYRAWRERPLDHDRLTALVDGMPPRAAKSIWDGILQMERWSVYDAYNTATSIATHEMRSARTAFELLDRVNREFQQHFPPADH